MLQDYIHSETYKRHASHRRNRLLLQRIPARIRHSSESSRFSRKFCRRTSIWRWLANTTHSRRSHDQSRQFHSERFHEDISPSQRIGGLPDTESIPPEQAHQVSMLTISCCLRIHATSASSQHSCTTHSSPVEETQQLTKSDLIWTLRTHYTSTYYSLSELKYNR